MANELNALNALAPGNVGAALVTYRGLSNDGLRVLAGLDGIDKVFMQITPQPLDPDEPDAAAPDGLRWRRVGPDVAPDALTAGERAYVDVLDGRGTNRWFYRCAYVDEVYNVGPLGLSSPPVWLPDVVPPRAPAITKVTGGNNVIALRWASNREADLAEYRIYRADRVERGRDLRLMTRIRIEPVAAGPPSGRPSEFMWTDASVVPNQTYVYRITAVDNAGNESSPSSPAHGRAYREVPPDAPAWVSATREVVAGAPLVRLIWTLNEPLAVVVQRRPTAASLWRTLGAWLPVGTTTFDDPTADPATPYSYRLRGRDIAGMQTDLSDVMNVPPL